MATNPYEYALNLLSARAYTSRNLRRKLVGKDFDPADIDAAIDRLTGNGLVDDGKYAYEFARQRLVIRGEAARRVEQALRQKGISASVATEAIAAVLESEPIDSTAVVERAAQKKLAALGDLERDVKRRRLFAHLARKGYDLEIIKRVMRDLAL